VHASWSNPRRQQYLRNLMRRSGAVQVSSAPLAEHFRSLNGEIHVFPNHVAALSPPRRRADAQEVVVGWGGSAGICRT